MQEAIDLQKAIDEDVSLCDKLIKNSDSHNPEEYIDCIINYLGRYGRFDNDQQFIFNLNQRITRQPKDSAYYVIYIKQIRSKIIGLKPIARALTNSDSKISISNNSSSNSNMSVQLQVDITVNDVVESISELPGLSDSELDKIKETIIKVDDIINSDSQKREKWSKLKEYLPSILDNGLEVSRIVLGWIFKTI
ncbi:MAG: hypothetical protein E7Z64_03630 [Thermoplasmata archaeon]|nr:hypothetical protein [Thermoplasmata archaeon]